MVQYKHSTVFIMKIERTPKRTMYNHEEGWGLKVHQHQQKDNHKLLQNEANIAINQKTVLKQPTV